METSYFTSGTVLNERYKLIAPTGAGSTSNVYKGIDRSRKKFVAIKTLCIDNDDYKHIAEAEAKILARLSHPNIIRFRDSIVDDDKHHLVTDFADGGNLRDLIVCNHPLPINVILCIGIQLMQAINYLHTHSILHRDIKPSNLLLINGRLCVCDLGLAQNISASEEHDDLICGTLTYCSPETLSGINDPARDVWAAGITLYEMLAGRQPYPDTRVLETVTNIISYPIPDIRDIRSDIPEFLGDIVMQMLDRNPMNRLSNPLCILAYLREMQDQYQSVSVYH